jgi:hypothetical protein
MINIYSQKTKKKVEDILNDKISISDALIQMKNDNNIIHYYYYHNDNLYLLFEYILNEASILKRDRDIDIKLNCDIDDIFAIKIDIDIIKKMIIEPNKFFNFNIKKNKINGINIIKKIILENDDKMLDCFINNYKIKITDDDTGCGIQYKDLLNDAILSNNCNIVNIINKCYYELKYINNINHTSIIEKNTETKTFKILNLNAISNIANIIMIPMLLYISMQVKLC